MPRVLFTRETAREMARRSAEAQRLKRGQIATVQPSQATITPSEAYSAKRLARIRKQLDLVDKRIEEEALKDGSLGPDGKTPIVCDGQLLNWLCSAQERLSEQERILSGRPLPGSLKPTQARVRATVMPTAIAPAPAEEPPDLPA